jgi:hypothetical protein
MREDHGRTKDERAGADGVLSAHPALIRMRERFPLLGELATVRFACDETFRDMCEDYDTCAETLAHLESRQPPPEGMRAEYTALLLRLEREMLRHLGEIPKHGES